MEDKVQKRRLKSAILRNLIMMDNIPMYPERGITTAEIHKLLEKDGYCISKRTIQRDLEKLAEWAELAHEDDENGYRRWFRDLKITDVMDVVPASEAFLLVLSEKLLRKTVPVNLSEKLEKWLNKADARLSTKHLFSNWKSKVNVVPDSYPLIYDEQHVDEEYRKVIYDCVLNEGQLKVKYQSDRTALVKDYVLNPLGLIIRDQSHYLVATKKDTPEIPQLFLFHRISFADKTYSDITKPTSFTIEEYFARNPTGWLLEDYPEEIVLKVKKHALDVLTHNKLAVDQEIVTIDATWSKVKFTNFQTYDLMAWILRYGDDVVVQSPEKLVERVKKKLMNSINNYS